MRILRAAPVASFFLLCGAAPAPRYFFPEELVQVYSMYPAEPPYCATYRSGEKTLVFLAAKHGPDSFAAAAAQLAGPPAPQAVIVEMSDPQIADGLFVAAHAHESEPHFIAKRAGELGIPVIGGEPLPADELSAVTGSGEFGVKDYEGFYVVRTLLAGRREESVAKIVGEFAREFAVGDPSRLFTDADFRDWYEKRNEKKFSPGTLADDEAWPAEGRTLFTRRVAAAACRVRDVRLGRRIADALNSRDRVLVVYGAGHQVELARALERMLGRPELGVCPLK